MDNGRRKQGQQASACGKGAHPTHIFLRIIEMREETDRRNRSDRCFSNENPKQREATFIY